MRENERLHEAILIAARAHQGQFRKGRDIDYITHPMEVLQILTAMDADEELLISGVLHDTVEDTDMSIADVREQFGEDVANLIGGHTEDKSKSWEVRKQSMIDAVAEGDMRLKMLVMADILSNMRNSWSDYQKEGDTFWGKFNAPKIKQSWYYSTMLDAVYDLQFEENAADFYWEATAVYKDIFVRYYLDEEKQQIYQIAEHGEGSVLTLGNPQWSPIEDKMPEQLLPLSREEAEQLEDESCKPFWAQHEQEMTEEKIKQRLSGRAAEYFMFLDDGDDE